uniref:Integrase catalytic domain-containing protein n=1 Tax=Physcomitrium patens TaxID=3218 RepID=A0A2K1IHS9_PHYPA|nr:hypothetical protein PHYPA_027525 [Physcomitrium patens]
MVIFLDDNVNLSSNIHTKITNSIQLQISSESINSVTKNSNLWHRKLGHISTSRLKQLAKTQVVTGFSLKHVSQQMCSTCVHGKQMATKFQKIATTRATQLLEVIHSDLSGRIVPPTFLGYEYYVTFIDDFSRYIVLRLLHQKKAHGIQCQLTTPYTPRQNGIAERKNCTLFNTTWCLLHESTLSKPYWGEAVTCATYLQNRCPTKAIPPDTTPFELWHKRKPDIAHLRVFGSQCFAKIPDPLRVKLDNKTHECIFLDYSPFSKGYKVQQISNGSMITSRDVVFKEELGLEYYSVPPALRASNFELQNDPCFYQPTGSSTLHSSGTSSGLTQEVIPSDRPPSSLPPLLPLDNIMVRPATSPQLTVLLHLESSADPSALSALPTFGSPVLPPPIHPRSVFPQPETRSSVSPGRDTFSPVRSSHDPRSGLALMPHLGKQTQLPSPAPTQSAAPSAAPGHLSVAAAPVPLHQSFHTTKGVPPPWDPNENYNPEILKPRSKKSRRPPHALISVKEVPLEPTTYVQAINSLEAFQWKIAIAEELNSHAVNSTWTFTHLPPHRKAITCRWIFKIKLKNSGAVDRFKARLVARGFNQIQGLDYHETFSPVVRIQSIRLILALAVQLDLHVHQMDVKTAFLNGSLQEEIYMKIPEGVINTYLATLGFINSTADGNVYYLHRGSDFAILTLYVDDTLIASSSLLLLHNIKQQLHSRFLLSGLGEAHHILSLETTRDRQHGWIRVSQQLYLTQKLLEFGFLDSKPVSTPMAPGTRLSSAGCPSTEEDRRSSSEFLYANAVGSLNWAAICMRPDISFATSVLAQFMHNPGPAHIRACKHTFRYLRILAYYIEYRPSLPTPMPLYGCSDADWAGDLDERRSTSGYCFILSEGVISWSSTRQRSTALSSTEAEYMAIAMAASELVCIRHLLHDLRQTETLNYPTEIHCDNQSALALVDTTKFHSRTNHIAIRYHFIRQLATLQKLKFRYCSTHHMRADLFTKSLSGPKLAQHLPLLGILGGETPATS